MLLQRLVQPSRPAFPVMMNARDTDACLPADPVDFVDQPRQVLHLLRSAAEARRPVQVNSPHLARSTGSRLMGVDPECDRMMLAMFPADEFNRILVAEQQVNLVIDHLGAAELCTVTILGTSRFHQRPCFVTSLPTWILVGQLRAHLRVPLRPSFPATLRVDFANRDCLEARVIDMSEGGLGLLVPHQPLRGTRLQELWRDCRLTPDKGSLAPLDLRVRHVAGAADGQRIGVAIERTSGAALQRLRRLVLKLQSPGRAGSVPPAPTFSMR